MLPHLRANIWLLVLSVGLCCVVYPGVLLVIGQTVFHDQAQGSLVYDRDNEAIGSWLIAQPFTGDGYFRPRPSAASYNAAASGATNWGANNYLLRDRVARLLGPIVKYAGARQGQPVGPDVELWFQQDEYRGTSGIVALWAQAHPTLAFNWVNSDPMNGAYVESWRNDHAGEVTRWKHDHPDVFDSQPVDLAIAFFTSFSKAFPGMFPGPVEYTTDDGQSGTRIEPVNQGSDIQGIFFDMWRDEHAEAQLEDVPADFVMASGSGLDPHVTLKNALYQLDRVAAKWAAETNRDIASVRTEIEDLLRKHATVPLGGLVGVRLVNVLEVNLLLRECFQKNGRKT